MPELIEISGLGQDSKKPEIPTQAIIALGVVGLAVYLINRLFPIRSSTGRIPKPNELLIPGLEDYAGLGVVAPCRARDRDPKRPARDQRWCLWTSKKTRILGRHPTREKALSQERLIQMRKRGR